MCVSQPSCFRVRLSAAPPPCTMTSLWPSRTRLGMVLANLPDQLFVVERRATDFDDQLHCSPSFSSKPNIRFMFCTAWPGSALQQVVETGNQHGALAVGRQRETDVAVICVERKLDLRQACSSEHAHPRLAGIKLTQRLLQLFGAHWLRQLHVNRRENAARDRQQMRRKLQRAAADPELLEHLPRVPVSENAVGARSRRPPRRNGSLPTSVFPAPETPDFESQMMPCSTSTKPARIQGASARMIDVE